MRKGKVALVTGGRGGPMFYANTTGLERVLARIQEFERIHGSDLWSQAPLLKQLVAQGQNFAAYDEQRTGGAAA